MDFVRVWFEYRRVRAVAQLQRHGVEAAPSECKEPRIWKEEEASRLTVCLAVQASKEDAEAALANYRKFAERWLREHAAIKTILNRSGA